MLLFLGSNESSPLTQKITKSVNNIWFTQLALNECHDMRQILLALISTIGYDIRVRSRAWLWVHLSILSRHNNNETWRGRKRKRTIASRERNLYDCALSHGSMLDAWSLHRCTKVIDEYCADVGGELKMLENISELLKLRVSSSNLFYTFVARSFQLSMDMYLVFPKLQQSDMICYKRIQKYRCQG